ncbi:MAG: transporter ATP-binding protein [Clostridia bacterium]|jgi:putative ABC transport system ATP-binding protein|nr:transporter ATP-binding protein [Clostridia bacterium]
MFQIIDLKYKNILDIKELEIPGQRITCIVGQSGSGKTTLLRMLNKLISPDSGKILYNDENLKEIDSIGLRRKVVMLPQTPVIFNGTIRDNLQIGLKLAEKPEAADSELLEILEKVHLKKGLDENADKLSGGEKQRLALGRVMLLKPEVLLLDEPSSALDEETEQLIIESVVEFSKRNNRTLIMVTHSKKVADTFADNIIEIKEGKVVEA